jgi:hypothetical protein
MKKSSVESVSYTYSDCYMREVPVPWPQYLPLYPVTEIRSPYDLPLQHSKEVSFRTAIVTSKDKIEK